MLPWILTCALAAPFQSEGVRVLARDDAGFGVAAIVTADRTWAVPIPLTSRSEVVQRVVPGPDGLVLRFEGLADPAAVTVESVAHAVDHQVLILEGEAVLVGPPALPRSAVIEGDPPRDVLPEIARRDAVAVAAAGLRVSAPEGPNTPVKDRRWVVVCRWNESSPWSTELGPIEALHLSEPGMESLVRWNEPWAGGPQVQIDQIFVARIARVPVESRSVLQPSATSSDAGWLELAFSRPDDREGTHTLLVTVRPTKASAGVGTPTWGSAPAPALFLDRGRTLGVEFSHLEGPDEQLDIRPTMGPGAAWGDVDGDGWNDLYLVQGGGRNGSDVSANRLLHNHGGKHFIDVTDTVGGGDRGASMGALCFDGDGDGRLDLYVANYGADALFANRPHTETAEEMRGRLPGFSPPTDYRLVDVGAAAGVGGAKWSAGVAASDYDRDGDLDLYVTSYLVYDPALMPPVGELAYSREDPIEMLPFAFPGQANTFLKNESGAAGMRFVDVTDELGVADEQGRGMQPVFLDFDRDGDDDLYVANDVSYNVLFRNEGDGTFKDVSFPAGLDDPRGGMGLAVGDVDGDGDEDVFLTNWELEVNALYLNNLLSNKSQRHRVATFRDGIVASGLGPAGIGRTSWGAELFDLENDGDLDLFVANGYTSPDYESTGICVGQPNHLFLNDGTGKFVDASAKAGPDVTRKLPSRAAVACDFDQDGDVDLVVTANNGPVQLLRNETPEPEKGHWLLVRLRGTDGNTHGIGADVTVQAGGRLWRRQLRAGTSYLGGNAPELHFGLGTADAIESIAVRWPSGKTTRHAVDGVDRLVTLGE
jgi:hypothetical protein